MNCVIKFKYTSTQAIGVARLIETSAWLMLFSNSLQKLGTSDACTYNAILLFEFHVWFKRIH